MLLKQRQKQDQAWDDHELTKDGLKIVVIENFYTEEELAQTTDVDSLIAEI